MSKNSKQLIVPTHMSTALPTIGTRPALPKVKTVSPFGSKILVEILRDDEIIGSNLLLGAAGKGTGTGGDGAPQAVIVKLGPGVDASTGLKEGQRIYWTGKGTAISDPQTHEGRTRALLEISNILAIIEEDK